MTDSFDIWRNTPWLHEVYAAVEKAMAELAKTGNGPLTLHTQHGDVVLRVGGYDEVAAEREACAKLADEEQVAPKSERYSSHNQACEAIATAIRARGEVKP